MTDKTDTPDLSRRRLLTRLGLAAGAAYVAPALLHLDAAEAAQRVSRPTKPSRPRRRPRPGKPSRPSRPSRPAR